MKQLVSIVKDGHVRYYVAEGGELEEVARIRVGERFSAEATAALGLNLIAAIGPAARPAPAPAPVAAIAVGPAGKGTKSRRGKGKRDRSVTQKITLDAVLAATKVVGPARVGDVAATLGVTNELDKKLVMNRLNHLKKNGAVVAVRGDKNHLLYEAVETPSLTVPPSTNGAHAALASV